MTLPAGRARPLLLLLVGAGTLMVGVPAGAAPAVATARTSSASEAEALSLLSRAAQATRSRTFSGTQYVSSWSAGTSSVRVLDVNSEPATAEALDGQLLAQLGSTYSLTVSGTGTCSGRGVTIVEVTRSNGRVAARFWLDRASGLPLRRDVWDAQGQPLRSSTFVSVQVGTPQSAAAAAETGPDTLPTADWRAPETLPGGFALFAVSRPRHGSGAVQHLAYSDGLSAVSVFSQPGELGTAVAPGYDRVDVAGSAVWVDAGMPSRAVWSGDGQVFTMVTDAGQDELRDAVAALPHDAAPEGGPVPRLGRGMARLGSWLTPSW